MKPKAVISALTGPYTITPAATYSMPRDTVLDTHVGQTQKLNRGEGWIFTRRGSAPIDATYATAGAVHLARTLPPPLPPLESA